jgi:protein-tyrosine phosphatase
MLKTKIVCTPRKPRRAFFIEIMNLIDFHAHILPGADHGSDGNGTSLAQLDYASSVGVTAVVATPHFYPHKHQVKDFLDKRAESFNELRSAYSGNVDIILGAEVLLCENINKLPGIENLCISGTRAILIELPFSSFKHIYYETVDALIFDGFDVILAHADRYDADVIESLVSLGAKIQLNASALSTLFMKKHVRSWLDRGLVVAIGSDIHMADKKAYASYKKAANKTLKYNIMERTAKIIRQD